MKMVQVMSVDALRKERKRLSDKIDAIRRSLEGAAGSPGEWIIERLGEIEAELEERKNFHY